MNSVNRSWSRLIPVLVLWVFMGHGGQVAADELPTPTEQWLAAHQKPNPTKYFGETINLSLKNADLVEVLRSFAEIGNFNLVLQPGIQGTVTVELKDVPWDQALEQILKINNLGMDISGGKVSVGHGLGVGARTPVSEMVTVELPLQHADATVVARALSGSEGVPSRGGMVRAEVEGNRLILRDLRSTLHDIGRVLSYVDVPSAAQEAPAELEERSAALWRKMVVVSSTGV